MEKNTSETSVLSTLQLYFRVDITNSQEITSLKTTLPQSAYMNFKGSVPQNYKNIFFSPDF